MPAVKGTVAGLRHLLALAASVAMLAAPGPAGAAPRKERCVSSGPRVVATTGRATVSVRRGRPRPFATYLVCDRRTGETHLLVRNDGFSSEQVLGVVAVGGYVAVALELDDASGARNVIRAFDVDRGFVYVEDVPQYAVGSRGRPHEPPASLLVAPDGGVAWISTRPGDPTLDVFYARRATTAVPVLLDQGTDVAPDSLALGDRYVYWQRSGPRVAAR